MFLEDGYIKRGSQSVNKFECQTFVKQIPESIPEGSI